MQFKSNDRLNEYFLGAHLQPIFIFCIIHLQVVTSCCPHRLLRTSASIRLQPCSAPLHRHSQHPRNHPAAVMSGSNVLAAKDVNTSMPSAQDALESNGKTDVRSMEYHRQVLQSKMEHEYVSPASPPCSAPGAEQATPADHNTLGPSSIFPPRTTS